MADQISLTKNLRISNGGHILYLFENLNCYMENVISYIKSGLIRDQHLLIIENESVFAQMVTRMERELSPRQLERIHYVDNHSFYLQYGNFYGKSIVEHFGRLLGPFFAEGISVRTWAHVEWREQNEICKRLDEFEQLADLSVCGHNIISVCAYDASNLPATQQVCMMRNHEYLMTDHEFVRSSLYRTPQRKSHL